MAAKIQTAVTLIIMGLLVVVVADSLVQWLRPARRRIPREGTETAGALAAS